MSIHKIDGGPGGENNHFPKKFVTLYSADASITAGDWVMIHPTDTTNGLGASVTKRAYHWRGNSDDYCCRQHRNSDCWKVRECQRNHRADCWNVSYGYQCKRWAISAVY